jgi:hypothetical protein
MRFVTCVCTAALSAVFADSAQAQAQATVTFSASPTSIPSGQSSTLAWSSTNATACSGTGKKFSPSGPSGSLAVSPGVATTYGITCTGAGGSASQSVAVAVTAAPTLAVGETVATTEKIYAYSTPAPNTPTIGSEAPGNQGVVIGGPTSNGNTWWQVSFNDGLTGWTYQSGVAAVSPTAPTVSFSANPASVPPGVSSTLSWSSTNATSCSGAGFSPSGASGSLSVLPTATTTYSITCSGSSGSTTQSAAVVVNPHPTIGMTVAATGTLYAYPTPSPNASAIGSEASGNQGVVIGGPVSAGTATLWEVAFNDNLTGWAYQSSLGLASPTAPTLSFSAGPGGIAPGASSTLSWSSTNATSCSGAGFSPSGASGSLSVSPSVSITYSITCTGSGGSTTRSAAVIVNPVPNFSWNQSLPVTFNNPAIVPFGGTETRALVFMDGSLYAGIGDWEDPQLENPQTPGAQVLRLDSPTSGWVEDQDFNQPLTGQTTNKNYQAVANLGTAHFDQDSGNNPITPVDVLMAGFWSMGKGLTISQKTVKTGSVGAQGTWTMVPLVAPPNDTAQVRSFTSYTDSVTHVEMAFAGSNYYGIFSGAFNSTSNGIQWGASGEAGSVSLTKNGRVMSFAACGGKLYASIYDAIVVRTDGANPSWQIFYQYSGPALPSPSSGFRGLTCVPNLNGVGSMLIAALESDSIDIYDIPLDGSRPIIELHTSNYLATRLGTWVGYGIAAYNNMIVYPQSGSPSCPDLLIGLSIIAAQYAQEYQNYYPTPSFLIRHCNGFYDFQTIVVPSITPAPSPIATRALAVSQFSGDPAGTLYTGGFDAHHLPAHNTAWLYKGIPQ